MPDTNTYTCDYTLDQFTCDYSLDQFTCDYAFDSDTLTTAVLLEDGDYRLLESGDILLLG